MPAMLIWEGAGVYSPTVTSCGVEWQRDTTGNPFVGVQVDSPANAEKFAQVEYPVQWRAVNDKWRRA